MRAKQLSDRGGLADGLLPPVPVEKRGLVELPADVEAHRCNRESEHEGQAPAERLDLLGREQVGHEVTREARQEKRPGLACLLPRSVAAPHSGRGVLDEKGHGAPDLAAGREALEQAGQDDEDRCGRTDRRVARREGDDGGPHGHQQDRQAEGRPAAGAVGIASQDERTDGSHDEPDGEGAENDQQRGQLALRREKIPGDEDGKEGIGAEVEPLKGVAEGDGKDEPGGSRRLRTVRYRLMSFHRFPPSLRKLPAGVAKRTASIPEALYRPARWRSIALIA
ncbi:MAG: hypothetical protein A4E67_01225 [Syntrophaceae bacterium PtaB.Bin038]|nr:MAG: hypothetical protein A4E67_01225 [Syntrophaceae bacterium PtaB.Bin038]